MKRKFNKYTEKKIKLNQLFKYKLNKSIFRETLKRSRFNRKREKRKARFFARQRNRRVILRFPRRVITIVEELPFGDLCLAEMVSGNQATTTIARKTRRGGV